MIPTTVTLLRIILLAALVGLILLSYFFEGRGRRHRIVFTVLFTFVGVASVAGYFNFGQFRDEGGVVNAWEHFHFFLGSKYLPEVS